MDYHHGSYMHSMEGEDGVKTSRGGRGRGRGRGGRGRGVRGGRGGRGGRGKKNVKPVESDGEEDVPIQPDVGSAGMDEGGEQDLPPPSKIDLEADILQLEAPTFSTINRGPPEPMLRLRWDHRVNLVAEKVLNPMIHCCDTCLKPILIYGRMIPCKHVFCLACAKREDKACPRCMQKVARVEQTGLGSVFMCTHGGTRYGNAGCRRTYLSQRDLQAHFNHRHVSSSVAALGGATGDSSQDQASPVLILNTGSSAREGIPGGTRLKPPQPSPQHMVSTNDPRIPQSMDHAHHARRNSPPPPQFLAHRPPLNAPAPMYQPPTMRTNLITVQIQDTSTTCDTTNAVAPAYYTQPPPVTPYGPPPPSPYTVPPPVPPPQFYPGPPQAGPPFSGPPPMPPRAPVPYQEASPYNPPPPPPQWQHPPPTTNQQFYH